MGTQTKSRDERGARTGMAGRRAGGAAIALVLAFMFIAPAALAVHDEGLFELDGNATASAAPGDDWSQVYAHTSAAFATSFITDGDAPADTTYLHTGGSKDIHDFDQWVRTTTDEAPDKDEIMHAFAAAYDSSGGDLVLYFGLDRFDASGDSQVGFWFAKDHVGIDGTNVTGHHQVGDVLVLSDFVTGGSVPVVRVFKWVGSGGSDGPIDEITPSGSADCRTAAGGDAACAIVNGATASSPWPFTDKEGGHTFAPGEFFEAGVNLTKLGLADNCFSTFIAETRTSQSVDARLKDVAMGALPVCGISVTKTGDRLSKVGDPTHYTITVTNTGGLTVYKKSIADDIVGDLTDGTNGSITSTTCGASLAPGASCVIHLAYTVQQGDPDPLVNTVNVVYDTHANLDGTDVSDGAHHSTNLFQPSVTIRKGGNTTAKVGDEVTYTFHIANPSSADSPNLLLNSISDTLLGDLKTEALAAGCGSLAPGATCDFVKRRVVQESDPDPLPNTVTVHYHPDGFPNDIHASAEHTVNLFGPTITVEKNGDTLGKIGDNVHYTFKITNTSTEDSPNLILDSVTDTLLGDLTPAAAAADCGTLAAGASCDFTADRVVKAGDPDPLPNIVTVHYHPSGSEDDVQAADDHSVNLFQPSVTVAKDGPATATAGKPLTYTFTVTNTSSSDSPPLNLASMTDAGDGWPGLGDLTADATAAGCGALAPGSSCSFQETITTPTGPDPLANTVSVLYHPRGFPNDIRAQASHSLRIVQVLGEKLVRTGADVGKFLASGVALVLAGLGLRRLVTWVPPR